MIFKNQVEILRKDLKDYKINIEIRREYAKGMVFTKHFDLKKKSNNIVSFIGNLVLCF